MVPDEQRITEPISLRAPREEAQRVSKAKSLARGTSEQLRLLNDPQTGQLLGCNAWLSRHRSRPGKGSA